MYRNSSLWVHSIRGISGLGHPHRHPARASARSQHTRTRAADPFPGHLGCGAAGLLTSGYWPSAPRRTVSGAKGPRSTGPRWQWVGAACRITMGPPRRRANSCLGAGCSGSDEGSPGPIEVTRRDRPGPKQEGQGDRRPLRPSCCCCCCLGPSHGSPWGARQSPATRPRRRLPSPGPRSAHARRPRGCGSEVHAKFSAAPRGAGRGAGVTAVRPDLELVAERRGPRGRGPKLKGEAAPEVG